MFDCITPINTELLQLSFDLIGIRLKGLLFLLPLLWMRKLRKVGLQERTDRCGGDGKEELLEHPEALVLILDEWIALRVARECYLLAQVRHGIDVFHPMCIDSVEDDDLLGALADLRSEVPRLLLVERQNHPCYELLYLLGALQRL